MVDNPSTPVTLESKEQDPSPLAMQMWQRDIAFIQELFDSKIDSLRQHVVTRMDGMDKALTKAEQYPTDIDLASTRMREYVNGLMDSVNIRFEERDHRFEIRDNGNKDLLAEQRRSAKEAIAKAEDSVAKQLDSQQRQIDGLQRLMDKSEGKTKGAVELWGIIVAVIMVTGAIVGIITTVVLQ